MKKTLQYTIRNVPDSVDRALRSMAVREGRSTGGTEVRYHDLDELAGSWVEDKAFDEAIEAFEQIDERMWK